MQNFLQTNLQAVGFDGRELYDWKQTQTILCDVNRIIPVI